MRALSLTRLTAATAVIAGLALAPAAARAAEPRMTFDSQMRVDTTCFPVTNPSGGTSTLFGRRFTDGPVNPAAPAIVLVHGIASSADNWDFSPTWSVARALASAGYVVYAYDRLGYARSTYDQPGGGYALTTHAQRDVLHQVVGEVKTGGYFTTSGSGCAAPSAPGTIRSATVAIIGHSAGGWIVAGYPGTYHDVAAMIQTDITGSESPDTSNSGGSSGGSSGGGFTPDPARPDYFEFFQTRQNCEDFNTYPPGIVPSVVNIACTPPFLDSPYGEIADLGAMYAENDAAISQIGPSTPVLLTSGDHDTTAPPSAARNDFAYYKAHCGCDVSQWIVPDTAHLFMVHTSLAPWVTYVVNWLSRHGVASPLGQAGSSQAATPGTTGSSPSSSSLRRSARGLTARVRSRRGSRFRISGSLLLYTGMRPQDVCSKGVVSVQTKLGKHTLSARRARLSAACTWHVSVAFHARDHLRGRRLRFIIRFPGNDALRATKPLTRRATAR
jgi:pimeloyl-ACP methyl ester carboxylesterase